MNKNYFFVVAMIVASMFCVDASAQGFLKKLGKKAEKTVTRTVQKKVNNVVNGVVDEVLDNGSTSDKRSDGEKNADRKRSTVGKRTSTSTRRGNSGLRNQRSTSVANADNFRAGTKMITVKLSEGIGYPDIPGYGTNNKPSKEAPTSNANQRKMEEWLYSIAPAQEYTNERLKEELKILEKRLWTDDCYVHKGNIEKELSDRISNINYAIGGMLKMAKEGDKSLDYDDYWTDEKAVNVMVKGLSADSYKRAMRSSLAVLLPSLDPEVRDFLTTHDVNTYTVDVEVFKGGSGDPNEVKVGDVWYVVYPGKGTAACRRYASNAVGASVVIPNSIEYGGRRFAVTEVIDNAFLHTKVTKVQLPSGLKKLGPSVFAYTDISSLELPNSLTELGFNTFAFCSKLKTIVIPNSVKTIPYAIFYDCTALTSVVLPQSVTKMGANMFDGCTALTSVSLPQNINTLPTGTFMRCKSLAKVDIPASVTKIGDHCFEGCTSLKTLPMGENVKEIDWYAFKGCTGLTSVVVPSSVDLGMGVFSGCTNLRSATISERYKTDGEYFQMLNSIFEKCPVMTPRGNNGTGKLKFHNQ